MMKQSGILVTGKKSIVAISFIFLGLNTLNAEEKPQLPPLPVEVFKIENK